MFMSVESLLPISSVIFSTLFSRAEMRVTCSASAAVERAISLSNTILLFLMRIQIESSYGSS
jgi:hypothetical protein